MSAALPSSTCWSITTRASWVLARLHPLLPSNLTLLLLSSTLEHIAATLPSCWPLVTPRVHTFLLCLFCDIWPHSLSGVVARPLPLYSTAVASYTASGVVTRRSSLSRVSLEQVNIANRHCSVVSTTQPFACACHRHHHQLPKDHLEGCLPSGCIA